MPAVRSISLTVLFGLCCVVLLRAPPIETTTRARLSAIALVWFVFVGVLGALGVFSAAGLGTPAIALAILVPVLTGVFTVAPSERWRRVVLDTPLSVLIGVHAGRLLGVFFLLLFSAGRLPPTFALIAGWGDIAIAAAAVPLARAVRQRYKGWRPATLAWNVLGFVDLVTAVTLGVGSAPNSPVRFI
jgi:hypothetical protein